MRKVASASRIRGGPMAEIGIMIEAEGWNAVPELATLIKRAAEAAFSASGREGDITVMLGDDAQIRRLNAGFRGFDKSTNVLSFPAPVMPGDPDPLLGDIALAYETCAREAEEEGKALADHLAHLVVHGVLHLLGHDHESDAEADAMEALETRILAGLGIADPYAAPAPEAIQ